MGTVLSFKGTIAPYPRRDQPNGTVTGEIVIFPGGHDGNDDYDGGKHRPRKSS